MSSFGFFHFFLFVNFQFLTTLDHHPSTLILFQFSIFITTSTGNFFQFSKYLPLDRCHFSREFLKFLVQWVLTSIALTLPIHHCYTNQHYLLFVPDANKNFCHMGGWVSTLRMTFWSLFSQVGLFGFTFHHLLARQEYHPMVSLFNQQFDRVAVIFKWCCSGMGSDLRLTGPIFLELCILKDLL